MPRINPELTISKILAILNAIGLCYLSQTLYAHENLSFAQYLTFVLVPLGLTTLLFWFNRYLIASGLIGFYALISFGSVGCMLTFDHDARYNTTKSNLSSIKSAIQMYRSRHSQFPQPTTSGATGHTLNKKKTLEAILSNTAGHGDGQEYIGGAIPGELLSVDQGNNYVCIVTLEWQFFSDQSSFQNCLNPNKQNYNDKSMGGYVYHPESGALRLNFKINQDDLNSEQQDNVGELFSDWEEWSSNNLDLDDDYPVRW